MAEGNNPGVTPDEGEIVLSRIFNAPRELVFEAWTDPEQLLRWYAPTGCTLKIHTLDFRPGGIFRHSISNPAGRDCMCSGVYREIVAPERLVFTVFFSDDAGNLIEPADVGMDPGWPRETTITVTFAEHQGGTKLTLHQTVLASLAQRTGALPSWINMLDRLDSELAKTKSLSATA